MRCIHHCKPNRTSSNVMQPRRRSLSRDVSSLLCVVHAQSSSMDALSLSVAAGLATGVDLKLASVRMM